MAGNNRAKARNDSAKPLKSLMLWRFGVFVTVAVLLFIGTLMALVFVSGTETETITSDGLNEQLRDHIRYVAIEKSAKLTEEFAALEQGVIGVSKHVLDEAVLEAPLPLDVPSTDYHTVALPDSLTALTARRSQPVSLEHSVYYAPEAEGPLSATSLQLRDYSLHMNHFFRDMWDFHDDVIAMYVGFESQGFFRLYPGESDVFSDATYDPRARGWYILAKSKSDASLVHTDPYLDAFGQGWLVSIAQQVAETGPAITSGVTSIDVKISSIQQDVVSTLFFDQPAVQLVTLSGVVVASPAWDPSVTNSTTLLWSDDHRASSSAANLPDFSEGFFADVLANTQSPVAKTLQYTDSAGTTYSVARSFLPTYPTDIGNEDVSGWQPRYVVIVAVPQSVTDTIVNDMSETISTDTTEFALLALAVLLVTYIVVIVALLLFVKSIVRPLRLIEEYAGHVTQDAQQSTVDIKKLREEEHACHTTEIKEFMKEFGDMLENLSSGTTKAHIMTQAQSNGLAGDPNSAVHRAMCSMGLRDPHDVPPATGRPLTFVYPVAGADGAGEGAGAGAGAGAGGVGAGADSTGHARVTAADEVEMKH